MKPTSRLSYQVLSRAGTFCLSCCAWLSIIAAPLEIKLTCPTNRITAYEKIEFDLKISDTFTNPFDPEEVAVSLEVTAPDGHMVSVPAFWYQPYEHRRVGSGGQGRDWFYPAGMPGWKARFTPSNPGVYKASARVVHQNQTAASAALDFECSRGTAKGFLRTSRKDPRFFAFDTGEPFFAIGQNLAFIGSQQYVTLSKAEEILGKLSRSGANYLRVWTCCDDWAMAIESRKSAFGRSWDWHPPLVAMPGLEGSNRKCLKLSVERKAIRIDPSHPVALKPDTSYVFSGKTRLEDNVSLSAELGGQEVSLRPAASAKSSWREFRYEFKTRADEFWLPPLQLRLDGAGSIWVADLSLKESAGGPELLGEADPNNPVRGYYNPLDCFMLDELLASAERRGVYLQLCLLARNLYMDALKEPSNPEYDRAIHDACKTFRYAVARWGYSTAVAAWEYWNEEDPGLPTDKFYSALGEYLESADPYHHLRTTSTWGPSAKDCHHPKLDIADVHFYLRPADRDRLSDEVAAVLDRTRWLREQAPDKPAHLGEFGIANKKWQPRPEAAQSANLSDLHNALWASALSGTSGTAMFWWWERIDQRDFYPQYRPLSRFIADVPWTSGQVQPLEASCSDSRVRVVGLRAVDRAWLWLFNSEASWLNTVVEHHSPEAVSGAVVQVAEPEGDFEVIWVDTSTGRDIAHNQARAETGHLELKPPRFERDLACRVKPLK